MKINVALFFTLLSTVVYGQSNIQESAYTHLSANDLIVGETLYFSSYVYSERTGKLSDLSKLLYIELLKSNGEPVYQTKLLLENGKGDGQYFIPTNIETGTYHLVAYTRWMKNFDKFSEQSLTIVNPYLTQKFEKKPETILNVKCSVEGGTLMPNVKNRVVLRVTNQFGKGIQTKGKIVAKNGGETIDVLTDNYGYFGFDLLPSTQSNYQFILETKNQFEFYDLPRVSSTDIGMTVIDVGDALVFKVLGASSEDFAQGILKISSRDQVDIVQTIAVNTAFSVQKNTLPQGLLYASFSIGSANVTDRILWNGPWNVRPVVNLGKFRALSDVSMSFEVADSCKLSLVVEQVDQINLVDNIRSVSTWRNQLTPNLSPAFLNSVKLAQLDDVLIASTWIENGDAPDSVKYLPEFRSGLVQGTAFDSLGKPVAHVPVGLALAGENRQFSASRTNSVGGFVLPYSPNNELDVTTLEVMNHQTNMTLAVEPEFYSKYKSFNDPPIFFDSLWVVDIVKRSIQNQLINAYSDTLNTAKWPEQPEQFYGIKSYHLDDFTRFSSMRDTFIELIVEVGVSKKEKNHEFKMRTEESATGLFSKSPTLLLLDGGFVQSEDLMNLSPFVVERIEVLNKRYYFGETIFDGVISIVTFKGDRGEVEPVGNDVPLVPVQAHQQEVQDSMSSGDNDRRPNFKDLLYWNPKIQHAGGKLPISFSTSEVTGLFEIRLEGVSNSGKPISRSAYFTVE
ncbi:hypothetical protein SAMN04488029_0615 [Reichenbachiella faecimaris]|uniref:MG2 domain-containing protein n=1 Tax=Reichenbachiella faecimaris TaxID=692418 RepID=A0A1W2G759_REIFA|nr:hypothetical protein [Reichenbachiella faecimaris]SMD32272.1 hypothetical protein SAMN04488029_0615 [Reichenbachiella faecimaris]